MHFYWQIDIQYLYQFHLLFFHQLYFSNRLFFKFFLFVISLYLNLINRRLTSSCDSNSRLIVIWRSWSLLFFRCQVFELLHSFSSYYNFLMNVFSSRWIALLRHLIVFFSRIFFLPYWICIFIHRLMIALRSSTFCFFVSRFYSEKMMRNFCCEATLWTSAKMPSFQFYSIANKKNAVCFSRLSIWLCDTLLLQRWRFDLVCLVQNICPRLSVHASKLDQLINNLFHIFIYYLKKKNWF